MTYDPYAAPVPAWLEDEILLVENSGEMPQVALAESLHHLGEMSREERGLLRAAAVRAYLNIIERDLEPAHVGQSLFRGLERAGDNLERLRAFLGTLGWQPPPGRWAALAPRLAAYLEAEEQALDQGREYASASPEQVRRVAGLVGLDLGPFAALLERMAALPSPDFLGLRAIERLRLAPGGAAKRRQEAGGKARLEVMDGQGAPLTSAELNLMGADDCEDPACRQRLEQVWELLKLPEV
ncbi:MAG: hypothetical protein K9K66_01080 [Desulfarculaceae bacterium]|nr:hypothetical protein [Desulfarculaceae bacterium]MCF8072306.1 hypothetical protein [Desulfarculaceae bacterium]MCF8100227.1 hypothetical protein [Desulfarculaceae bacterium]MCF8116200.1 hypothetical protein [Desulfarculaceae bacterium]